MATTHDRGAARLMGAPAIVLLFIWMIVPLALTLYFSFLRYNLLEADAGAWLTGGLASAGTHNYYFFLTDPAFKTAILNTLTLTGGVLAITLIGGTLLALLLDQPFWGRGAVRLMMIAPFFVMPTVSALVWKNMFMNPVNGLLAWIAKSFGAEPIDWLGAHPMLSIVIMVSWAWLPFATLILLTALQSLDQEQKEAAEMDGAGALSIFRHITVPHLSRALTVVMLMETIFLLNVFAEILVSTNGGPGTATTNLSFLVYAQGLLAFDVGGASAGGVIAVILANIVAFFLMRLIGKTLE